MTFNMLNFWLAVDTVVFKYAVLPSHFIYFMCILIVDSHAVKCYLVGLGIVRKCILQQKIKWMMLNVLNTVVFLCQVNLQS
jgi:hypothetical protein